MGRTTSGREHTPSTLREVGAFARPSQVAGAGGRSRRGTFLPRGNCIDFDYRILALLSSGHVAARRRWADVTSRG